MKKLIILFTICLIIVFACKDPYEPPATTQNVNLLVVEGTINPDSTTILLSRTRTLQDTTRIFPEPNAVVFIEGQSGVSYPLRSQQNGFYTIGSLPLSLTEKYKLKITVSSKQYESDFVSLQRTPAIDSVSWTRDSSVSITVNTHDPSNNTRYYRWEYVETWEFHSYYQSLLGYKNGQVYYRDSSDLLGVCYNTDASSQIILGTSAQLSSDKIENAPITTIPDGSEKLGVLYSILVKQYALNKDAYNFWQLLRRNTSEVGGLFDAQPSQLTGNLRCVSNPTEPVLGFVSASTVETKRIFIRREELPGWNSGNENFTCIPKIITDSLQYYLSDTAWAPAYFVSGGGLAIAKNVCVDCRRHGGSTTKPSFWP